MSMGACGAGSFENETAPRQRRTHRGVESDSLEGAHGMRHGRSGDTGEEMHGYFSYICGL